MDYRVRAGEIPEDQTTAMMESYSAKLPTSFFLGAALTSILGSLLLKTNGKDHHALFIGQWAAPFLLLGIYNKMVKQHGSDAGVKLDSALVAAESLSSPAPFSETPACHSRYAGVLRVYSSSSSSGRRDYYAPHAPVRGCQASKP